MINSMFSFIYCLPISYTVIILIFVCCLWRIVGSKIKDEQLRTWRLFNFILFVIWFICVVYRTIFTRNMVVNEINLIPFHSIIDVLNGGSIEFLRVIWMNTLLFVPGSMWLYYSNSKQSWGKWIFQIMFFMLISICIEFVQGYFQIGVVEVDDVIHNTLGAVLGITSDIWSEKLISLTKHTVFKIKSMMIK